MKRYDLLVIPKDLGHQDLFETFSRDYLLLFSWINQDLEITLPNASLSLFQVVAREIICAGAGLYWTYGPSLRHLQEVSLHPLAKLLNYQLDCSLLAMESIEGLRRTENLLELMLASGWGECINTQHFYYFDQLQRLLAVVRQSAEQIELLNYATELELPFDRPIPPSAVALN